MDAIIHFVGHELEFKGDIMRSLHKLKPSKELSQMKLLILHNKEKNRIYLLEGKLTQIVLGTPFKDDISSVKDFDLSEEVCIMNATSSMLHGLLPEQERASYFVSLKEGYSLIDLSAYYCDARDKDEYSDNNSSEGETVPDLVPLEKTHVAKQISGSDRPVARKRYKSTERDTLNRSPFSFFQREMNRTVSKLNPDLTRKEILALLEEDWRLMNDSDKIKYVKISEAYHERIRERDERNLIRYRMSSAHLNRGRLTSRPENEST